VTAAVTIEDVRKRYGGRDVLAGISLEVRTGETFALLGPNGAGKTTTVEIVEGYRRADGGRVRVLDEDPARAGRDHRARIGLMLQGGGGIDPRMSAREVLDLYGAFHAAPSSTEDLIDTLGLAGVADTRYQRLSGGERQRLGIALALVGRPELVILDEPTAGMDVEGRTSIRELLGRLRADGVTILLTSHDLGDVERVADRIAILDRGRIVAVGALGELAAAEATLRFHVDRPLDAVDRADLARHVGRFMDDGGGRYRLAAAPATPATVAAVAAWFEARGVLLVELRTGAATLEERYLEILAAAEGLEDAP
jgi:ABC-2 type transport system ATP-binding protein